MLPCGDVQAALIEYLTEYFTDVVGDVSLVADCLTADTMAALTTRLESILGTAKNWEEDVGTEEEFKEIDWSWITYDLTAEDITEEFLQTNYESMEEIQAIVDVLINGDIKLIDTIQKEIGNVEDATTTSTVTTTVATTTGNGMAATTAVTTAATTAATTATTTAATTGAATTTSNAIDGGANTVTTGATTISGNPYAPGQGKLISN